MAHVITILICSIYPLLSFASADGDLRTFQNLISESIAKSSEGSGIFLPQLLARQTELRGSELSCDRIEEIGNQVIASSISPIQFISNVAARAPDLLILGETHYPADFWKWSEDTVRQYRSTRPDVDCFLVEDHLISLEAELILFGKALYDSTRDIEATVEAFAGSKGLAFTSFKEYSTDGNFNMRIGPSGGGLNSFGGLENISSSTVFFNSNDLRDAFENGLKRIKVDFRQAGYNRDVFMAQFMSGLIKNGFCKAAVVQVGKGHVLPLKLQLNNLGVSNFTVGLWSQNSHETEGLSPTGPMRFSEAGFLSHQRQCPTIRIDVPIRPFAIVSRTNWNVRTNDKEDDFFKFTLNMFDAHIVAPVLPVNSNLDNYDSVPNIYRSS